jgi:hypothetical protein
MGFYNEGRMTLTKAAQRLQMSTSDCSKEIGFLVNAKFLTEEFFGSYIYYNLSPSGLEEALKFKQPLNPNTRDIHKCKSCGRCWSKEDLKTHYRVDNEMVPDSDYDDLTPSSWITHHEMQRFITEYRCPVCNNPIIEEKGILFNSSKKKSKPRFTQQEIENAKSLKLILGATDDSIISMDHSRSCMGDLILKNVYRNGIIFLNSKSFPSITSSKEYSIKEILKDEELYNSCP